MIDNLKAFSVGILMLLILILVIAFYYAAFIVALIAMSLLAGKIFIISQKEYKDSLK